MDGAVGERRGEGVVDEPVLVDEREPLEAGAGDRHLEVVTAPSAVEHGELGRIGKRLLQEVFERLGHHGCIVASALDFYAPEC